MRVTKSLKKGISYVMAVSMIVVGMSGYKMTSAKADSIQWNCIGGSIWTKYLTYPQHSDKAAQRKPHAVAYYVAEKSSETLNDLYLPSVTEYNIVMENGAGEGENLLTSEDKVQFYITTGKVKASEFTEDDLVKNSGKVKEVTVDANNKVTFAGSQNDNRKILTDNYTSMKVVNGDKYMVLWFRAGVPEGYYETVSTWTKLCSYNGNDIYYSVSLNGNEGFSAIAYDEDSINISANSSAATYRSGRFYGIDGTNESLDSKLYVNKTYLLPLEKLAQPGNASFYMAAAQGEKSSYGIGVDFQVVSQGTEETTPQETTTEEVTTPEETTPEETTTPEVVETTTEATPVDKTYTFTDNGTEMPTLFDRTKTVAEQMPATLSLKATDGEGAVTDVIVQVSNWSLENEEIIVGRYVTPQATFTYEEKEYTYQPKALLVYSPQLVYFVDCNSGSTVEFPAIAEKVSLINGTTADQEFDTTADKSWGYVKKGNVKKLDSYPNGLYNTGYYAASNTGTITYQYWLEKGTYQFTSGHCEWWGGGNSRQVKAVISYTDKDGAVHTEEMGVSKGNTTKGEQPAIVNKFTVRNVDEGANVTVTFSRSSGVAPAVAYMAFEKSLVTIPDKPTGLQYAGNDELPYYFAWSSMEGAESYNVYINGTLVGTTITSAYNAEADLFKQEGEYTIEVSAVNSAGESEKAAVVYTVEKQTSTEESTTPEESTEKQTGGEETSTETPKDDTTQAPTTQAPTTQAPTTQAPAQNTVVKVAKAKVKSATKKQTAQKVKILLRKVRGAKKYQIQISTSKKFKKKLVNKTVKKAKITIKSRKLENKTKLYVRARAVKVVNKKNYTGKWSKVKKIKINK